ncbi:hypothetical protein J1N35_034544 [Gossypium stocksii]|uniref:Uncharacterized protein n=1 Tax=Gossypium stocksii TaxID=47602 RepID=A0A9D3UU52_9ROSI|nr:hypothetical protein J1N35_034544 [Gossypium stocksii]
MITKLQFQSYASTTGEVQDGPPKKLSTTQSSAHYHRYVSMILFSGIELVMLGFKMAEIVGFLAEVELKLVDVLDIV